MARGETLPSLFLYARGARGFYLLCPFFVPRKTFRKGFIIMPNTVIPKKVVDKMIRHSMMHRAHVSPVIEASCEVMKKPLDLAAIKNLQLELFLADPNTYEEAMAVAMAFESAYTAIYPLNKEKDSSNAL